MNPFPFSTHALWMAALVVFVGWRIYRRVRRQFGRQRVHRRRLTMTAIFFPLLLVLVALPSVALGDLRIVEAIVAGVVLGVLVGLIGLKLTRFEVDERGGCYVPNTWLGVAVSLLFVGRLAYRFGVVYLSAGTIGPSALQSFGRSPLTLALFGVVAAYYATYAIGVLVWFARAKDGAASTAGAADGTARRSTA